MRDRYERRIGAEEEERGFIAVMKSDIGVFRPSGRPSTARSEGSANSFRSSRTLRVPGPEKPHEHWFIHWPGIRRGQTVTFVREGESTFTVTVNP
jgi:hypothetical protein